MKEETREEKLLRLYRHNGEVFSNNKDRTDTWDRQMTRDICHAMKQQLPPATQKRIHYAYSLVTTSRVGFVKTDAVTGIYLKMCEYLTQSERQLIEYVLRPYAFEYLQAPRAPISRAMLSLAIAAFCELERISLSEFD